MTQCIYYNNNNITIHSVLSNPPLEVDRPEPDSNRTLNAYSLCCRKETRFDLDSMTDNDIHGCYTECCGGVCKLKYAYNPINFIRISIFAITKEAGINKQQNE